MSTALLKGGEDKWKKLSRERVAGMVGGFAIMASVALCCAAFLLSPSGAAPQSKEQLPGQPISREQLMHLRGRQAMMNAIVPAGAGTRKSRRTLALEAYLNRVMQGVKTLDQVDHAALAAGLTAHMCAPPPRVTAAVTATTTSPSSFVFLYAATQLLAARISASHLDAIFGISLIHQC